MLKCLKYGIQPSMISLNVCASWFAPLLFACKTLGFSRQSWYKPVYETKYWKKSLWIVVHEHLIYDFRQTQYVPFFNKPDEEVI